MRIDYYCFPTKTGDISVFTDLDQYTYWREREYYQITREDVFLAKENGKLILFDLRSNTFTDADGKVVDISEKIIFPRSPIQEAHVLIENIERVGGKSIISEQDYEIIEEHWFEIIKTKRKMKITTMAELEKNLEQYERAYGNKLFVKTVKKGFSEVCNILELSLSENALKSKILFDSHFHSANMRISKETPIIVCQKLDIVKDEFGKREWRAFVVDNELLCLSRASDDVVPIEEDVYIKVQKRINEFKGMIPSSYVVDFFEYTDDTETVFDVCEFNPIISSGVYQNNDLVI